MVQTTNEQAQLEAVGSPVPENNESSNIKKVETDAATRRADAEHKRRRAFCSPILILLGSLRSLFAGMISLSASAGQGMSKFYWHIPVLYGDKTSREWPEITGFKSGCAAGGKSLFYGFYDGITGVVTLPYKGARGAGIKGFGIGVLHGIGGLFFKPLSGIWAFIGHPIFGLHKHISNREHGRQQQNLLSVV
ncbi:hypothetical protein F5Y10DRAFT_239370 [Nemania abortiva]|nr:hypothetical protein F5Y10DRAFT_239370 [Nemania abortiva]